MCVCILPPHHLHKAHVGGDIFCRVSTINRYMDMYPEWHNLGPLGTDGIEGETADQDVPETWGWTLTDVQLSAAAVQAHLPW